MIERQRDTLVSLRAQAGTTFVSQGRTVFVASEDGFVERDDVHGLFAHETRVVCRYRYLIDDKVPQPVALSNVAQHTWLGYYITLPPGVDPGPPDMGSGQVQPEFVNTLEMRLSRYVGDGMHEDVDLTNFSDITTTFRLDLEIDADFADRVELRSGRMQDGPVARDWQRTDDGTWELTFDYRVEHTYDHQGDRGTARIHRGLRLQVSNADTPPSYADGRLSWEVELAPLASWHTCIDLTPMIDGTVLSPLYGCHSLTGVHNDRDRERELFLHEATAFATSESATLAPIVVAALEQAKHDLAALRLYDLDHDSRAWTMAAGLPMYTALYGRDTLAASWQAVLASPTMLRGTLPELVRWQGTTVNDWRDEQPGRMLHEAHTGPLSALHYTPQGRYYGSITTSSFYAVALAELWHWTGDIEAMRPLLEPAMKALRWLEGWCDPNGDGFYEYQTRSEQGTVNQAWKDSSDAIVDEDGKIVVPPIATCEEQGFVYMSKLYLAEILWWLNGKDESQRLRREASELRKRFNEAFWMEDQGFFALGLDHQGRHIRSISSNPGPCIGTGIVDDALVEQVANRLMAPTCLRAGAYGRFHPSIRPSTRLATIAALCGLWSTALSHKALVATACTSISIPLPAPNSRRRRVSCITACPKCSAGTNATPITRSRRCTRRRTRRKHGRRRRSCRWCNRCWACSRMLHSICWCSIRIFPRGCPTSRCETFTSARLRCRYGFDARQMAPRTMRCSTRTVRCMWYASRACGPKY